MPGLLRQRAIERNHVRAAKQFVESQSRDRVRTLALRTAGGQNRRAHVHAQGTRRDRQATTDRTVADDAERLSLELQERTLPVAIVDRPLPIARMHGSIMQPDPVAELEQQRERVLHDARRAVRRYVAHCDAAFRRRLEIDGIDARRQHAHAAEQWQLGEGIAPQLRLVQQYDVRLPSSLDRFGLARPLVDRQLAKLGQLRPRIVTRVHRVTVEHHDFRHLS
jgi:hypothetical protein